MAVQTLPPSRLLDRRKGTLLHCACTGFRTRSRPAVVQKLLSADPVSANIEDERGRTSQSLLFDNYAKEVMEALEDDVMPEMVRRQTRRGATFMSAGRSRACCCRGCTRAAWMTRRS